MTGPGRPRNDVPSRQQAAELIQAFTRFGRPEYLRGDERRAVQAVIEEHWSRKRQAASRELIAGAIATEIERRKSGSDKRNRR
jgi:hypothetical protein